MKIGIPVTCIGIIILVKNRTNSIFLNLKSYLAKMKAAKLEADNVKKVEHKVTIRLLRVDFKNGSSVKTFIYDSNDTFLGIHSIGREVSA